MLLEILFADRILSFMVVSYVEAAEDNTKFTVHSDQFGTRELKLDNVLTLTLTNLHTGAILRTYSKKA